MTKYSIIGSFLCLIVVSFLTGCDKNPVRARLADIETFAESNPDSARRALEAIDPAFLNTRRLKAQHALMLSTALNRCKVKVPNDSLINIAVDYYDRFGPAKEKFLSYYYQGRVYQDQGDYESAMQSYLNAESIHSKDISLKYLTSVQLKKGEIYQEYYYFEKAVEAYRKAQRYALQCEWIPNYHTALNGELAQYIICEEKEEADSMIRFIKPFRPEMSLGRRAKFDNLVILFLLQQGAPKDSLKRLVHAYELDYSLQEDFPWTIQSLFYSWVGDFTDAKRALNQHELSIDNVDSDKQYLRASAVLNDSLGLVLEGQIASKALHEILGRDVYEKGSSDLRFLEERAKKEKQAAMLRKVLLYGSVVVLFLCAASILGLRRRRKQKEAVSLLYASLKEEYAQMSAVLQNNSSIQDEARALLGQRVKSLAQFLSVDPPSSLDKVADQLDSLTENRKELLETIGLLYAVYHPSFVNRLQMCGLSNGEIGYCCLLILGFRTGEIGDVINRSSSYHISSAIRQKVGLGPNDTNLSIFLKNLFQETET